MRARGLSPWPQWTTVMVGGLLMVSGLLLLAERSRLTLPVTDTFLIPLNGPIVSLLAALTRAAAFTIAATGLRGELGFTAQSTPGGAALIIWGLRDLVLLVVTILPPLDALALAVVAIAVVSLQILFTIAAVTAAISITRARVLVGKVRWVLLPLAIVEVVFTLLSYLPVVVRGSAEFVAVALAAAPTEFIEPVLILLIAASLSTWGRIEAIKHHARLIHDAW